MNVQLIGARNAAHLWGAIYDRDLADAFDGAGVNQFLVEGNQEGFIAGRGER